MLPGFSGGRRISIHAPARGATSGTMRINYIYKISIHAPARGATVIIPEASTYLVISIHAPARGATVPKACESSCHSISIHAPARGATSLRFNYNTKQQYFYPRSRKGSDGSWPRCAADTNNFYPRSRKGSDFCYLFHLFHHQHFYPRSRKGSDVDIHGGVHNSQRISIHAPARGATSFTRISPSTMEISIHAPARGATDFRGFFRAKKSFLSTLPQGERRPFQRASWCVIQDFYPRSRKGSDILYVSSRVNYRIFLSTLPQGERRSPALLNRQHHQISIHAPARGATFNTCPGKQIG